MSMRRLFRRAQWDRERAAEMDAYLEFETAANVERGMSPAEAHGAARRKLGNATLIREEIYRMNSIVVLESLRQDVQYAFRVLRKSPGFALVAILSLALGIGANTAGFSIVHALLLRALPYTDPDRVVAIGQKPMHLGVDISETLFWKENARSFSSVAGFAGGGEVNVTYGATPASAVANRVSDGFFRTLGVTPAIGREFSAAEAKPGGPAAAVLSDVLWRRLSGGDPNMVGRAIGIGGRTYTVVGVLAPGFWFLQDGDLFVPLRPSGGNGDYGRNGYMIGRLKPGVTIEQAAAEMPALLQNYRRTLPSEWADGEFNFGIEPLRQWLTGNLRTKVLLLFAATGLLLLIACTNLAGLLLARLEQRQKEITMRLALGSSMARLLRGFVIENMLLCLLGSSTGVLAAAWLLRAIPAILPFQLPTGDPVRVEWPVLLFTIAVTAATGLAFSLAPFLKAAKADLQSSLKSSGRWAGAARQRARGVLVAGEVALSVTLLVSAALLIQSLYRLNHESLGFRSQGLLTFWAPPAPQRYRTGADLWAFENLMMERLGGLHGVRSVAAINELPLTSQNNYPCEPEGRPDQAIGGMEIRVVTASYFGTMGIPILRGRGFTSSDMAQSQPVILVNDTVARRWWPKGNAIGDRVLVAHLHGKDLSGGLEHPREVVGIVADTKTVDLKKAARPTVYIAAGQAFSFEPGGMAWIVRADRPEAIADSVRRAVLEIEPRQRVLRMRTMEEIVAVTTADSRFDAWLFGAFAALALVLTAIGVYGLLSFAVARRTSEIGTRMALGAGRGDVLLMILRQGLGLTMVGLAVGLAGAAAVTRSLSTLLFGVKVRDPLSFVAVAAVLLVVGALASYLPARRATKVDPITALRYE